MIGDDILAVLPRLQAEAESLMRIPCTVTRVDGTHEVDGRDVPLTVEVWTGLCRVQSTNVGDASPEVAGATVTVQQYSIHVPVSAGPFREGDLIAADGREFRVTGLHRKTLQTAQRLPVDEVI